ncbi:MbnP family copper-binding protein [Agaribacter marinus]|uniref:Copper-binding protein MbnP-like domain-containing protein n=1 Tax=Agaribacter marinus TaxID=1431249 RepID=A0AA37T2Y9_9ALTE|nr:MbnP family copper-binding protein [Agaribacter marinus]GLR72566.1 hypothetical protein GCM10007852_34740 [Agaribacter marinus]
MFLGGNTAKEKVINKGVLSRLLLISIAIFFGIVGCSQNANVTNDNWVDLTFVLTYKQKQVLCGAEVDLAAKKWRINKFAFFVSNIHVGVDGGRWLHVENVPNDWQTEQTTLINLVARCSDSNDKNTNATVKFYLPNVVLDDIVKLKFSLFVPFEQNHLNPLIQAPPLNNAEMFWSWRQGHKFMRVDMQSEEDDWLFHLGSVGCESVAVVRPPPAPCKQANQFEIIVPLHIDNRRLEGNNNEYGRRLNMQIHLERLLDNTELTSEQSCMFMQSQKASCEVLTSNLVNNRVFTWQPN